MKVVHTARCFDSLGLLIKVDVGLCSLQMTTVLSEGGALFDWFFQQEMAGLILYGWCRLS